MNMDIVANSGHLEAVSSCLSGLPSRVRIYALTVHDVQLVGESLRTRLVRLLNLGCQVTIAFGEALWDSETLLPRDSDARATIAFLTELVEQRANVWYVPRPLLHAKVLYVEEWDEGGANVARTLVTSANITQRALRGENFELGTTFTDLPVDARIRVAIKKFTDGVLGSGRSLEDVVS